MYASISGLNVCGTNNSINVHVGFDQHYNALDVSVFKMNDSMHFSVYGVDTLHGSTYRYEIKSRFTLTKEEVVFTKSLIQDLINVTSNSYLKKMSHYYYDKVDDLLHSFIL